MMPCDQQAAGTILSRRRRCEMGARCLELCLCFALQDREAEAELEAELETELEAGTRIFLHYQAEHGQVTQRLPY